MKTKLPLLVAASLVLTPLFASAQTKPKKIPKSASSARSLTQDIVPLRPTPGSQPAKGRVGVTTAPTRKRATSKRPPISETDRKVFEFHKKRAEGGSANSQYEVGSRYLTGKGVEKDRAKSIQWLEKASKQGHKKAAQKLSFLKRTTPASTAKTSAKKPVGPAAKPATKVAPKAPVKK